jgi:hypothetical protein
MQPILISLFLAYKPGEDQSQEHALHHDDVGYVGDKVGLITDIR